jgi:citrate lyase subunit beta/citryl-CoA lyase
VLAVPGSSEKMLSKAQTLPVDAVFLDLEDAVAPAVKDGARALVVEALRAGDWSGKTVTVRINDATTPWAYGDLQAVIEGAGDLIDCIMLPKAERLADLHWLDTSLLQLERRHGLAEGRIGVEVQIEGPAGLAIAGELAAGSPRVETLIFGPGDFMAAMQYPSLTIGENAFGAYAPLDTVFVLLAVAARAHGVQVIDGPYGVIADLPGFEQAAERAVAFGFDGKWILHPSQVDAGNRIFSPRQGAYDRAEEILEAYDFSTSLEGGGLGAVMLGDEMIDEASRKMAEVTALKGRRAGLVRSTVSS